MRAVLYARVSSDEQTQGFSLTTQVQRMEEYAARNGFTVAQTLIEDFSGMYLERPELTKLLAMVETGAVDAVICYAADRLTRVPGHGDLLRSRFKRAGVALHYVSRGLVDTSTPIGEFLATMEDGGSRLWRDLFLEAARRGRAGKIAEGKFPGMGALSYGYRKEGKRRDMHLVVYEPEAEIVRLIFRWFVHDKLTRNAIAQRLTDMHVLTPGRGKLEKQKNPYAWSPDSISKMLRNTMYSGVFYANRYREVAPDPVKHKPRALRKSPMNNVLRPKEEWIPIEVPRIVDEETWQAAQQRLDDGRRQQLASRGKYQYLMSGRMTCGVCKRAMVGRSHMDRSTLYLYYGCAHTDKKLYPCNARWVRAHIVEGHIWDYVTQLLLYPEATLNALKEMQGDLEREYSVVLEDIAHVRERIEAQEGRLSVFADMVADGDLTRAMFKQKAAEIEQLVAELKAEEARLEEKLEGATVGTSQVKTVETLSQELGLDEETLRNAPFELKRAIIEALDIRGEVGPKDNSDGTPNDKGRVLKVKWYKHSQEFGLESGIASSSASERAAAPWLRRRSRGCSVGGSSLIRR
jgi:site-specific DNA recombinase